MEFNWQVFLTHLDSFPVKLFCFPQKSEDKTTNSFLRIYYLGENYFQKGREGGGVYH